jgi:hypothetical protein
MSHQITCATKVHEHRHILGIGGPDGRWTVAQAYAAIDRGEDFHTVSPSTGKRARVVKYVCPCGTSSLTTTADAVHDNNLDYLPDCR